MIRISTGTQIALIARIALHLSYSDLTTPEMMSSIVMQEMTLSMVVVGLITIEQTIATVPQG
jgi:hypothetical protein